MTRLVIAIPSKGRLQEQTLDYLADAGLRLVQSGGARDYAASLAGADGVTVSLLSAAEIADELAAGRVHLGVTGEDLLAEHGAAPRVAVIERLGFGRADVVVAVPRSWIDVATMADLDDVAAAFHARHGRKLRVATKFIALSRRFFAAHGIADYRIIESLGATEGAPAAGTAEVVVDITTTGATLVANELKILVDGTILKSEAVLAAGLRAAWTPEARNAARSLLDRLGARVLARTMRIVDLPADSTAGPFIEELAATFGVRRLTQQGAPGTSLLVPEAHLDALVRHLRARQPAALFTLAKPTQVFAPGNALFERLEAALR